MLVMVEHVLHITNHTGLLVVDRINSEGSEEGINERMLSSYST